MQGIALPVPAEARTQAARPGLAGLRWSALRRLGKGAALSLPNCFWRQGETTFTLRNYGSEHIRDENDEAEIHDFCTFFRPRRRPAERA